MHILVTCAFTIPLLGIMSFPFSYVSSFALTITAWLFAYLLALLCVPPSWRRRLPSLIDESKLALSNLERQKQALIYEFRKAEAEVANYKLSFLGQAALIAKGVAVGAATVVVRGLVGAAFSGNLPSSSDAGLEMISTLDHMSKSNLFEDEKLAALKTRILEISLRGSKKEIEIQKNLNTFKNFTIILETQIRNLDLSWCGP